MKKLEYAKKAPNLLTLDVVNLILVLQTRYPFQPTDNCQNPKQRGSRSNKIEQIIIAGALLKDIINNKAIPSSRNEKEIDRYHDLLAPIHRNCDYITPHANIILQLHRDIYTALRLLTVNIKI